MSDVFVGSGSGRVEPRHLVSRCGVPEGATSVCVFTRGTRGIADGCGGNVTHGAADGGAAVRVRQDGKMWRKEN